MTAAANDASSCPHSTSSGQSHDYLAPYHRETHGDPCTKKALRRLQSAVPEHPPPPPKHLHLTFWGPRQSFVVIPASLPFPQPSNPQTLPFLCFALSPPFPISTRRAPTSAAIGSRLFCFCHLWQSRTPRCCRRLSPRSRCNPLRWTTRESNGRNCRHQTPTASASPQPEQESRSAPTVSNFFQTSSCIIHRRTTSTKIRFLSRRRHPTRR